MGSKPTVTVVPDPDALADAAARLIAEAAADAIEARGRFMWALAGGETPRATYARLALPPDRKSTRLNSSHLVISYAVFCLKKKKTKRSPRGTRKNRHNTRPLRSYRRNC